MKVCVVGCGTISNMHLNAVGSMKHASLVGVCDVKMDRATDAAKMYGGHPYQSLTEMLDAEKPDVLHICTPHYLHVPMAGEAAKRGIAVFTEKPPAISREQFKALKEFSRDIPIGVCFQNRYNATSRFVKERIGQHETGGFLGGRAFVTWCRDKNYYNGSDWRGELKKEGGGALINQSIHTLDLLIYFLGKPECVTAQMQNFHLDQVIDVEDTVEAYLQYKENASCLFYATTAYCTNSPVYLELIFEHMTIRLHDNEVEVLEEGKKDVKYQPAKEKTAAGKSYWGSSHDACIADFYHALKTDGKVPIGVCDVENTMDVLYDIYEQTGYVCETCQPAKAQL